MTSDFWLTLLVDVATHEKDPLRRVAFVAAFAMANYSSTIGRIAKPFNPMLVSLFCFSRFLLYYNNLHRVKLLNILVWTKIIDTCLSKSVIILLFRHVGQKVLCGIITARYVNGKC
jgi:hypothetical protein